MNMGHSNVKAMPGAAEKTFPFLQQPEKSKCMYFAVSQKNDKLHQAHLSLTLALVHASGAFSFSGHYGNIAPRGL